MTSVDALQPIPTMSRVCNGIIGVPVGPSGDADPQSASDEYIEAASSIAAQVCARATWSGRICSWGVSTTNTVNAGPPSPVITPAGPFLYQGTAGIGLFLSELYAVTHDARALKTAVGAVEHSLQGSHAINPTAFGFHTGRVGIAYAAHRLALATGDSRYVEAARSVLAPLFGREREDRGLDVIAGAAGAIPSLLLLAQQLELPAARHSAVALGEHLLHRAHRGPIGWSWRVGPSQVRNLLGLAHGAAGYGYALLELAQCVDDERFLYAAMQAFAYERYWFDRVRENWPDFRHLGLAELLHSAQDAEDLRQRLRAGEATAPYEHRCMLAWCHGAPGIGLTRARAHELVGGEHFAKEAALAANATLSALQRHDGNHSLCHGAFGNCETLLAVSRSLNDSRWEFGARLYVDRVLRDTGRNGWRSGAVGGGPDPSLLVGEAGIGLFFLRLAVPIVPSVLLPLAPVVGAPSRVVAAPVPTTGIVGEQSEQLWRSDAKQYFGRIAEVTARVLPNERSLAEEAADRAASSGEPLLVALYHTAEDRVATHSRLAARLRDAFGPERCRFRAALRASDTVKEEIADLLREPSSNITWDQSRFRLTTSAGTVRCRWDWDGRSGSASLYSLIG